MRLNYGLPGAGLGLLLRGSCMAVDSIRLHVGRDVTGEKLQTFVMGARNVGLVRTLDDMKPA